MKIINYQLADTLPDEMLKELKACEHAGEANAVFESWANACYVEHRSRASIWTELDLGIQI